MNTRASIIKSSVNYSYWESREYFGVYDLIVIGSGIVGLSTAISFAEKNKKAKVLVLERGILPSGASTKNAGFACFGSPSELLDDLANMPEETVWQTVEMRWQGLQLLQKRLGAKNINLWWLGGYELFDDESGFDTCAEKLTYLNKMVNQTIGLKNTYSIKNSVAKNFGGIKRVIKNSHEGQLDTGLMMKQLVSLTRKKNVDILNGVTVSGISDTASVVEIQSNMGIFKTRRCVVATNGFAADLLKVKNVKPARAQVLITKPIKNLKVKGCFHYNKGYYYFRNIDNRILFGGGRNLDFETETSPHLHLNMSIQTHLDKLLADMILPGVKHEVENRWAGIMGVGNEKKPIIEFVSSNVLAAVRMGGMGVAIGSLVGKIAAEKINGG
jgi:glycine/D-amino acid oxidase-like deaminating enzyme